MAVKTDDIAMVDVDAIVSEVNVGSKFQFSSRERAPIRSAVEDYNTEAKSATKKLAALNVSSLVVDSARSRGALVIEKVDFADDDSIVELDYKLRSTLGDALSMHARKLAKLEEKLPHLLVDTSDVSEAQERTQHIANKIGEQLTMHLETEGDD